MPASGRFRFEVGEPFYYYDVRAEVTFRGTVKEIVIVDENEELKKHRPFLYLSWLYHAMIWWWRI